MPLELVFSDAEDEKLQRKWNYERYRTLVQIDATGGESRNFSI